MVTSRVSRVHWLMPKGNGPGSMAKIACHLGASPGSYTVLPSRVTCPYCSKKPAFLEASRKELQSILCECTHRRGMHVRDGNGPCMLCGPMTLTHCQGFKEAT